jgi:transcription initiation factor TFIIB
MEGSSVVCPNCGTKAQDMVITDPESGEVICSSCGIVINENIEGNTIPTWMSFSSEQKYDKSRTGMPTTLARSDMGLSTVIGRTNRDASGHKIEAYTYSKMQRLRTWDLRTQLQSSTDRNLMIAFNKLYGLKDKLGLPDAVIDKTAYIYRKAQQRGLVRGRTIDNILVACVYAACRELGIPKTLKEVAKAGSVREKRLSKAFRTLRFELDLFAPMLDPMNCIVKVANKVSLNEKTKRNAMVIMNQVTEKEISAGKDPMGLAATILYISCLRTGENKAQAEIAKAAEVTEVTLRNRYKDLKQKLPGLNK